MDAFEYIKKSNGCSKKGRGIPVPTLLGGQPIIQFMGLDGSGLFRSQIRCWIETGLSNGICLMTLEEKTHNMSCRIRSG
jgi:hypothetical protein